nr:MAG TPA: hypothetical protein [Bacteriophage sp.]DAN86656.1 MAG TPA: hypothetical protein [Caudoviricetes sp.]
MPFLFVYYASSVLGRYGYIPSGKNQERNCPQAMPLSTKAGAFQFKRKVADPKACYLRIRSYSNLTPD